jgi:hypothetical protein
MGVRARRIPIKPKKRLFRYILDKLARGWFHLITKGKYYAVACLFLSGAASADIRIRSVGASAVDSVGSAQIIDSTVTLSDVDQSDFDTRYVTTGTAQTISGGKVFTTTVTIASTSERLLWVASNGSSASGDGATIVLEQNDGTGALFSEDLGRVEFVGWNGSALSEGSSITGDADGTWSGSVSPGRLLLRTTPAGTLTPADRVVISSRGDVRIANYTADVSIISNFSILYSTDVGSSSDLFVMNEAGVRTRLSGVRKASASLNFGATAAGSCEVLTMTVSGAADGDVVSLGIPAALAASDNYQSFYGYVSATNTVAVKRCNLTNTITALSNPAAVTVTVIVTPQ